MFGFFKRKPEPVAQDESLAPLIAIIEDEADLVHLLKFALEGAGYRVVHAENGETGLDVVREKHPALILLDIKMPVMNGYQVLATLHQDEVLASIPVIVMTSIANEEDISEEEWARKLNVARFLAKPFLPESIVEATRQVLTPTEN